MKFGLFPLSENRKLQVRKSKMLEWIQHYAGNSFHLDVAFVVCVGLLFKWITRTRATKLNLPPSPPGLPIIGNLHQLGDLPQHTLASLARKYGPVMTLRFGQRLVLVVSSEEAAKEMMKTRDLSFSDRPTTSFSITVLYSNRDMAFSPYGEYWRQVRKVCGLQLLNTARVESFRYVREEEVGLMVNKIRQACSSSSSVVDVTEMVMSFMMDVSCRITLGRKYDEEDAGGMKFWGMIKEFMYLIGVPNVGDFIPWLAWINHFNGYYARLKKNFEDLDSFFEDVINKHVEQRRKRKESGEGEGVQDFVDVLLGIEKEGTLSVPFSRENIKAVILDMFLAAVDTSSAAVIWAMTELIMHPKVMKQVQTEIRDVLKGKPNIEENDLEGMNYLRMILAEALRMHPPAPLLVPRESTQQTTLQGYDVPAKTIVYVNATAIGRDPLVWDEPEEFRPERFMNQSAEYKQQDFGTIAFGGGRRGCPGVLFASPNMLLPLANLLFHFDWSLPDGVQSLDFHEGCGIISYKKSPLLLAAKPHRF